MASVLRPALSFVGRRVGAAPLREVARASAQAGLPVRLRGVAKRYGPRAVLHDIDLAIGPGEFVVIIGRSGSGKSTLLRLLAGLETPDMGEVHLGGDGAGTRLRVMFQDGRLLPWRRVIDNVSLGLAKSEAHRATEALDAVGLADRAYEWPRVLSGGQKQRVALARALAADPRLILLDEPLGALDALTRLEMQGLIEDLWRRRGFTAVLVTHDVAEAALLADRIVLIEDGGIALDLRVDLPRPRRAGAAVAEIEATVLARLLGKTGGLGG